MAISNKMKTLLKHKYLRQLKIVREKGDKKRVEILEAKLKEIN